VRIFGNTNEQPDINDDIFACASFTCITEDFFRRSHITVTLIHPSDVTVTVTRDDPLANKETHHSGRQSLPDDTWNLISPDPQLLVLCVKQTSHVVLRYHPRINVVSCDDDFSGDVLGSLCEGDDGRREPHTALSFTFTLVLPTFCFTFTLILQTFCFTFTLVLRFTNFWFHYHVSFTNFLFHFHVSFTYFLFHFHVNFTNFLFHFHVSFTIYELLVSLSR
jgi:hypothetical protein